MTQRKSIHNAEDLARLPQWAQDDVLALMRDNARMKQELSAGPEDSDSFVDGRVRGVDRPLGKRPQINFGIHKFTTATGDHTEPIFQARIEDDGMLYVTAWHGRAVIRPQSSNAFYVQAVQR